MELINKESKHKEIVDKVIIAATSLIGSFIISMLINKFFSGYLSYFKIYSSLPVKEILTRSKVDYFIILLLITFLIIVFTSISKNKIYKKLSEHPLLVCKIKTIALNYFIVYLCLILFFIFLFIDSFNNLAVIPHFISDIFMNGAIHFIALVISVGISSDILAMKKTSLYIKEHKPIDIFQDLKNIIIHIKNNLFSYKNAAIILIVSIFIYIVLMCISHYMGYYTASFSYTFPSFEQEVASSEDYNVETSDISTYIVIAALTDNSYLCVNYDNFTNQNSNSENYYIVTSLNDKQIEDKYISSFEN